MQLARTLLTLAFLAVLYLFDSPALGLLAMLGVLVLAVLVLALWRPRRRPSLHSMADQAPGIRARRRHYPRPRSVSHTGDW